MRRINRRIWRGRGGKKWDDQSITERDTGGKIKAGRRRSGLEYFKKSCRTMSEF